MSRFELGNAIKIIVMAHSIVHDNQRKLCILNSLPGLFPGYSRDHSHGKLPHSQILNIVTSHIGIDGENGNLLSHN